MKIQKIINNNVISAIDENNREIIAMGCGIGFGVKKGQEPDKNKIEKIYRMEDETSLLKFKQLLENLPLEHVQLANEIISYAKKNSSMKLNQNIYITLTDHINFAINRFREGMVFQNILINEVQYFYPSEYNIAQHALDIIEDRTGIRLPDDEAASIAIHLVNAELDLKVQEAYKLTEALKKTVTMAEKEFWFLHEENYEKKWFLTQLKYLMHRIMFAGGQETKDKKLFTFVKENYKEEYEAVQRIKLFLREEYQCEMESDEEIYLALDIKRVKEYAERKEEYGLI